MRRSGRAIIGRTLPGGECMGRRMTETRSPLPELASIVAVDVVGARQRTDAEWRTMRSRMHEILSDALDSAGISLKSCLLEDRGDGVLVIAPARFGVEVLLGQLPEGLQAGIQAYNSQAPDPLGLQLRAAVDRGEVASDGYGVVGSIVNSVFRMLDAAQVKAASRDRRADLVLVTSDALFQGVKTSIDVSGFKEVPVRMKETTSTAWMRVYGEQREATGQAFSGVGAVSGDFVAANMIVTAPAIQVPVPFQLPAPTPDFVGREEALAALDAALAQVTDGQPASHRDDRGYGRSGQDSAGAAVGASGALPVP